MIEDSGMSPRSSQGRKIEMKINLSAATYDDLSALADAKDTPIAELARAAMERGITAIAKDETDKNVWLKTSLRGRLAKLILGIDDPDVMEAAIEAVKSVKAQASD